MLNQVKRQKNLAENEKIKISSYNIIYEVLDYIKLRMSGLLAPDITGNNFRCSTNFGDF